MLAYSNLEFQKFSREDPGTLPNKNLPLHHCVLLLLLWLSATQLQSIAAQCGQGPAT